MQNQSSNSNPREAAYLALMSAARNEGFISEFLEQWQSKVKPSTVDYHFAQQIACGTCQMALALDFLAEQLSDKKKLSLKLKEKVLLRLTLYQFYFLDRIPIYALTDESIKLAKKYCHNTFVGFLNACMRKLEKASAQLPQGNVPKDISIRYSFPLFFVERLIADYGLDQAKSILELSNNPAQTMARVRLNNINMPGLEIFAADPYTFGIIKDLSILPQITSSSSFYIQNMTPAELISYLSKGLKTQPQRILDLCASPGGKLLLAHDLFPQAELFANDVSEDKMQKLKENCNKYGLSVTVSCGKGEEYQNETSFDLIILDVPCSNTGVLNKRPEARWRISQEALSELEVTQTKLLENTAKLLAPNGEIWYLTCSILKDENERFMEKICARIGLKIRKQLTQLPSKEGRDGGYACSITKN